MERIQISVLIPMYQAEKYIEEAIRSVSLQSMPGTELIIVDDGSPDQSAEKADSALAQYFPDGSARLVRKPHCGQAAARNTALSLAGGDFIFFLDADDVLTAGALEAVLEIFAQYPDADIACARCRDFISPELTPEEASRLRPRREPYQRMLAGCTLIRRAVFDRVGKYDESLPGSETAQWMLRAQDEGVCIRYTDTVTLERRYHNDNFGRRSRQAQLQGYMNIIRQRRSRGVSREDRN